jgi:hypothetical protein
MSARKQMTTACALDMLRARAPENDAMSSLRQSNPVRRRRSGLLRRFAAGDHDRSAQSDFVTVLAPTDQR